MERQYGIIIHSKTRIHNLVAQRDDIFSMMAIQPHFVVEVVVKTISLLFVPFNQQWEMPLHHSALRNDPLWNEVPQYTFSDIEVYRLIKNLTSAI